MKEREDGVRGEGVKKRLVESERMWIWKGGRDEFGRVGGRDRVKVECSL